MPLVIDLHDESWQATKLPWSIGNRHRVCIKCLPPSATEVTHSTLAFIAQYLTRLVSQRPFLHGYVLFVKEPVCGNLIDDVSHNSFRKLKNLINAATTELNLTEDYMHYSYDSNYISIEKEFIINGNGHTIDANYISTVFSTTNPIVLKNIKFTNCRVDMDSGGARSSGQTCAVVNADRSLFPRPPGRGRFRPCLRDSRSSVFDSI